MLTDLFLKTHRTPRLSEEDRAALENAAARTARFPARSIIVEQQVPLSVCTLLLEGMVNRYKLADDGRRQILALHIPGDFIDLHSYPLKRLEHTVAAQTDCRVAIFPHPAVHALTERSPVLTELLWRSTLIDAAVNREWLVSVGSRPAAVRLAHLFCEMNVRLDRIGRVRDLMFDLPLTQADLADATGLTPVHVNRMLRELRERGLMDFRSSRATIRDWPGLQAFAEFDSAYLFLD